MPSRKTVSKPLNAAKAVKVAHPVPPVTPRMPTVDECLEFPGDVLILVGDDPSHPDFELLSACKRADDLLESSAALRAAGRPDFDMEDKYDEAVGIVSRMAAQTLAGQLGKLYVKGYAISDLADMQPRTKRALRNNRNEIAEACFEVLNIAYRALHHADSGEFWPMAGV